MPSTTVKITVKKEGSFDINQKRSRVELNLLSGMRQLIEDVHRVSRPITPMKDGDLRSDVKKKTSKLGSIIRGEIEWHRPYAWYQERGYTSGPVRKYTTAGTHAHFAEESVKAVTAKSKKYFGKKT
jgi:hypothetical protein